MGAHQAAQAGVTIQNISSRLTLEERTVRAEIMKAIITSGHPVRMSGAESLEGRLGLAAGKILSTLEAKNVIGRDHNGDIAYVYPVSAYPTSHKVSMKSGQVFHAMCAIDSLGSAFTFQQDIKIDSSCSLCNNPISISIENGQLLDYEPSTLHVLRYNLNTVESINKSR